MYNKVTLQKNLGLVLACMAFIQSFSVAAKELAENVVLHKDYRTTPQLVIIPSSSSKIGRLASKNALHQAKVYLEQNATTYGLAKDLSNLYLNKVKDSLIGTHFHFQQQIHGIDVENAEIVVSLDKKTHQIYKVYNDIYPETNSPPRQLKANINKQAAIEALWDYVQIEGKLLSQPKSQLVYLNEGLNFRLVYRVNLFASNPSASWKAYVDVNTGKVVRAFRNDLPIKPTRNTYGFGGKTLPALKSPKHIPFKIALTQFEEAQLIKKPSVDFISALSTVNGSAKVFDPDPRTRLQNDTMEDTDAGSNFTSAYISKTLLDITLNGSTYSLDGPWVKIAEIEAPTDAPSTTSDGDWSSFTRGNNAFNDANTYFHIDQNQRYIQSLGFTGSTGIQEGPISVDTDGVNGDDNSHFVPGTNILAFGHGCVDDNEDVDVILHEYGHSIQHDINYNWTGGDTGAMGEGFGDYWAGSYSYSTTNGQSFHPEWAFSWDGHNACWAGRVMNQTSFQYDSASTYGAHTTVGGVLGDELWSTPLFQSLVTLMADGVPRSEVDQIILESHFGLGSGVTMPQLALSTVQAAATLFPSGSHARVFYEKFAQVNILNSPLTVGTIALTGEGNNNAIDPGETVSMEVPLTNAGAATISSVTATMTAVTSGVILNTSQSAYPDMAASSQRSNSTLFNFTVPSSHTCGADIDLSLKMEYQNSGSKTDYLNLVLPTGVSSSTDYSVTPAASIPDNNSTGITSDIVISGATTSIQSSKLIVSVNITHPFRGDIKISLVSPTGTEVQLKAVSGSDSANDVNGIYPTTLSPVDNFSAWDGETLNGTWTLKISDNGAADVGTLNSWGISYSVPAFCNHLPTGTVTISGYTIDTQILTANDTIADIDGLGEITYTWKANGSTIGTGSTYLLTSSEIGKTLTVEASYTDIAGNQEVVTSSPTHIVITYLPDSDTDSDGMPDGWEIQHSLDPFVNDASDDINSNGVTNLQEYLNSLADFKVLKMKNNKIIVFPIRG